MTIFSYRKEITRDHVDVSRQIARRERLLGWTFLGDCLFFFFLSSFLLVKDLWPNIEGYSIIIITATFFLPFFFLFCLRWRFSEIFYFCSWDWVPWYFGDNPIWSNDLHARYIFFHFVKENCICLMKHKSSILE